MIVVFEKENYPDMFGIAQELQDFKSGKVPFMSLGDLKTMQSELARVIRECEEVKEFGTGYVYIK